MRCTAAGGLQLSGYSIGIFCADAGTVCGTVRPAVSVNARIPVAMRRHFADCQGVFFLAAFGTARIGISRTGGVADADRNAAFEVRQLEVTAIAAVGGADDLIKRRISRGGQRRSVTDFPAFWGGTSGPESDFADYGAGIADNLGDVIRTGHIYAPAALRGCHGITELRTAFGHAAEDFSRVKRTFDHGFAGTFGSGLRVAEGGARRRGCAGLSGGLCRSDQQNGGREEKGIRPRQTRHFETSSKR